VLSFFGIAPDYRGIATAGKYMNPQTDNVLVASGIAVQSQWAGGPQDDPNVMAVYDKVSTALGHDPGEHAYGIAQASYSQTNGGDPFDPAVAIATMNARINTALDKCGQCQSGADKLIVAALAQNGSEFGGKGAFKGLPENSGGTINWANYLSQNGNGSGDRLAQFRQSVTGMNYGTTFMLKLYLQDLRVLMQQGYQLPEGFTEDDVSDAEGYLP
jgi:hypothetical protein